MNKKITITSLIIGLIILVVFISGCINQNPNLKFSTGQCDSDIDPYSEPRAGILNEEWNDDSTLIVEGYVKTLCGGAKIYGDYSVDGNNLILKYEIKTGNEVTNCNCPHKVIYEISNLEKKDYSISITSK